MDETDWLTERFEEHRSRLRGVAYRMLGSLSEADDAVQEAWLRLARADPDSVADLPAWLTTVVARVCLNMLRTREHRREQPLDEYVPGPIIGHEVPSTLTARPNIVLWNAAADSIPTMPSFSRPSLTRSCGRSRKPQPPRSATASCD